MKANIQMLKMLPIEERYNMNTRNIIIVLVLLIVSVGFTNARADVIKDVVSEAKYEMKEFKEETVPAVVADVKALPENTKTFFAKEWAKTKEYQKQGWAESKQQTSKLVNDIKGFFSGLNKKAD